MALLNTEHIIQIATVFKPSPIMKWVVGVSTGTIDNVRHYAIQGDKVAMFDTKPQAERWMMREMFTGNVVGSAR